MIKERIPISGVLHQLLDLAFEIAGDGDAFFDHGLTSHS